MDNNYETLTLAEVMCAIHKVANKYEEIENKDTLDYIMESTAKKVAEDIEDEIFKTLSFKLSLRDKEESNENRVGENN